MNYLTNTAVAIAQPAVGAVTQPVLGAVAQGLMSPTRAKDLINLNQVGFLC
jgi:hypothetical protein